VQRAAEQRGAARSVGEDTGCGAALAAVEPIESGRKKKATAPIGADIAGGRARGARLRAPDRGAQPPRAAYRMLMFRLFNVLFARMVRFLY
jgi:hypothetical protein